MRLFFQFRLFGPIRTFGPVISVAALLCASGVQAATLECRRPGSPTMLRHEIVQHIVNAEAQRDDDGHLRVYSLPSVDGGGRYEVAGINERYHADMLRQLRRMIDAGDHQLAEAEAVAYIADYTDRYALRAKTGAIRYLLRDMTWNRGWTGAARILQIALGVPEDGLFGPQTHAALGRAERRPHKLIGALRVAREIYERRRRDEDSRFWRGLVRRWNTAGAQARCFFRPGAGMDWRPGKK